MTSVIRCQHSKPAKIVSEEGVKGQPPQNPKNKVEEEQPPIIFVKETKEFIDFAKYDDFEKYPSELKGKESILDKLKFVQSIKNVFKSKKTEKRTTSPAEEDVSSERVNFTDEEPIELKKESIIKLDRSDLSLWQPQGSIDYQVLPKHYMMLSKSRLTMLVATTSAAGYGLASSAYLSFDPLILAISTIGVALTSASANAINQMVEVPFDSQMNR